MVLVGLVSRLVENVNIRIFSDIINVRNTLHDGTKLSVTLTLF